MPATKDDNSPIKPAGSPKKQTGEGAAPGSQGERWRATRTLRELARAENPPNPPTCFGELELELALDFLTWYQALGRALVRAGFSRASRTPATVQPDWEGFALHIEDRFDPDSDGAVQGSVAYLCWSPENLALRDARIDASPLWETYSVDDDMVWLAEIIQRTANQLAHGISFMDQTACDVDQVCAAQFVIMAWAELDPEVQKWMWNVGPVS